MNLEFAYQIHAISKNCFYFFDRDFLEYCMVKEIHRLKHVRKNNFPSYSNLKIVVPDVK